VNSNTNVTAAFSQNSQDTIAPSIPGSLTATPVSTSQINLSWTSSSDNIGVSGYNIYRNGGSTPVASVSGTSYQNIGLSSNTTYSYGVQAYDSAGNRSTQNTASATTLGSTYKFVIGDRVRTTAGLKVRSSPATKASSLGTQGKGSYGSIIGGPVLGEGYTWWNINYDKGADGWSVDAYLSK
jgi:chitodextrinase